jgi:hypothetical protein
MAETATDTILREVRIAGRLSRLFKIERCGGFARRPVGTVQRLIERRSTLVEQLLLLDAARRSLASPRSTELRHALRELAHEVQRSRLSAESTSHRLGTDLRSRQGSGLTTGIRNSATGRLLGTS